MRPHADPVFAGAMTLLFQAQVWTADDFAGARPGCALLALCFTAALALHRRMTVVPLAAGVAFILIAHATVGELANSPFLGLGLVVCIYTAGNSGDRGVRLAGLAAAVGVVRLRPGTIRAFTPSMPAGTRC